MIPPKDAAYRLALVGGRVRLPVELAPQRFRSVPVPEAPGALPAISEAARAAGQSRAVRLGLLGCGAALLAAGSASWGGAATPLASVGGEVPGRLALGFAAAALALVTQPYWMPMPALGEARTRGPPIQVLSLDGSGLVLRVHDAELAAAIGRENGVAPIPEAGRGRGPGPRDAWLAGPVARALAVAAVVALAAALGG